jgi:hypothetical protein
MSIASLGIIGGLAGTQLPQRAAETEKVQQQQGEQSRAAEATERAEAAAGIGQTEEDSETSDRDADGRRLWEQPQSAAENAEPPTVADDSSPLRSKDPTGACGGQLDLVG